MKLSTQAGALVPAVKHIGQGLVLLSLLALLALLGAAISHAHSASAPTRIWMAPGPPTTPPPLLAASEGDIHIGSVTAPAPDATNGNIHIGG